MDTSVNMEIPAPNSNIHIWGGTLVEAIGVGNQMHPAILSQLKPCKTEADHNCLYNAVCLCLGMSEFKQNVLRKETVLCLQKHSDHFEELLKLSDEITLQSLIEQCKQPFLFEGWGNEFHILALAIMLKRNIIVYNSFKSPKGQFYQRKNKNIVGLAEQFTKGGDKIEQHVNFEPQKGVRCHNPIFLHLNGLHFTALIPRFPNPVLCVPPATNLPSIPNNGIELTSGHPSVHSKKMTRKARWLASKTPAQLAEYKAQEKNKKEKRKAAQEAANSDRTTEIAHTLCNQGSKRKSVEYEHDGKCSKMKIDTENSSVLSHTGTHYVSGLQQIAGTKRKDTEPMTVKDKSCYVNTKVTGNSATIAPHTGIQKPFNMDTNKKASQLNQGEYKTTSFACNRKLTKSERNKLYYEKNKEKIKNASRIKKLKGEKGPSNGMTKAEINKRYYEKHKDKMKEAQKEKYKDPVNRASILSKRKAAYAVPEKHKAELAAQRRAYRDPVKHAAVLANRKATYGVPEKRMDKLTRMKKFNENPVNHALILAKRRILYKKQSLKGQRRTKTSKKLNKSDYDILLSQARKAMLEMPVLACTVCHRARFKEQVKLCHRNKYPQSDIVLKCFTGKYIHKCSANCNDSSVYHDRKIKEWICHTCHRHLLKGNMPPQAVGNNLWMDDIPDELKALNALEMHLVSIVQPFMKIVPLPRGGQKGVRGQMVCVPANLQRTADSLPWTLNTNNLIRVKLKRKQQYKGHHLYMVVNQTRVMSALRKLMEINPAYKGKVFAFLFWMYH